MYRLVLAVAMLALAAFATVPAAQAQRAMAHPLPHPKAGKPTMPVSSRHDVAAQARN